MATNLMNILGMLGGQVGQLPMQPDEGGSSDPRLRATTYWDKYFPPPQVSAQEYIRENDPRPGSRQAIPRGPGPRQRKFELEKLKELNERFSEEKALELIKSGDIEASDRFGDAYLKALGEISPEVRHMASQDPEAVSRLQELLTPEQQLAKDREERPWNYEGPIRLPSKDPSWDTIRAITQDPLSSLGGFLAGGIGGLGKGAVSHVTGKPDPRSFAEAMSESAIGGMETAQDIAGWFTPPSSEIFPITPPTYYKDPETGEIKSRPAEMQWGKAIGDVLTLGARPIYKGLTGVGREKPGWTPGTPTPEQKPDKDGPAKDLKKEEGQISEKPGDPILDKEDQDSISPYNQMLTEIAKKHGITKEEVFKRLAQEELGAGSDDLDEFMTDITQRLTEALDRKPGWPEFLMAFALTLQGQDGVGYLRSRNSEYLGRARVLGNLLGEARSEKSRRDAMGASASQAQAKQYADLAEDYHKGLKDHYASNLQLAKDNIQDLKDRARLDPMGSPVNPDDMLKWTNERDRWRSYASILKKAGKWATDEDVTARYQELTKSKKK